ncbi:monothiol glutaredoxin-like protein-4 [Viridothelium virens]|uniref:Monothiol glutaredoxin-like protein-4 n=1 Tax=Viridothelium virens TaxID=1048519 RepID=A0A6A6HKE9_VIRVR|nr:monothiol glutaredoxin-like protein-4 [Viridothelium virens]
MDSTPLDQQAPSASNGTSNSTCTVTEITTEADFAQHTSSLPSETLLIIYFHAPWAAPCKQMSTVFSTLASTYPATQPPSTVFLSINAEEVAEISESYDVTQVPYVVLQKDRQTVDTVSGTDAARLRAAVERHVGKAGNPGKLGLPPPQQVTKQPESVATAAAAGVGPHTNGSGTTNGAKNLAQYAPGSGDPPTAPAYSSGENNKAELHARLGELVKAAPVMLFMKGTPSAPQCGFSRQTVSILRERGVRYGFFNILADDEVRQGLKEFADWPTFPQLWVDGELVGGLDIVKEEIENDPDFLKQYAVSTERNSGGPAAPEAQAQPA